MRHYSVVSRPISIDVAFATPSTFTTLHIQNLVCGLSVRCSFFLQIYTHRFVCFFFFIFIAFMCSSRSHLGSRTLPRMLSVCIAQSAWRFRIGAFDVAHDNSNTQKQTCIHKMQREKKSANCMPRTFCCTYVLCIIQIDAVRIRQNVHSIRTFALLFFADHFLHLSGYIWFYIYIPRTLTWCVNAECFIYWLFCFIHQCTLLFCSLLLWLAPLRIWVGKNRVAHIRQHFLTHAICKPDIKIYEPIFKCNKNGTQRCNPGWIEVNADFFRHLSTLSSVQSLTELCVCTLQHCTVCPCTMYA